MVNPISSNNAAANTISVADQAATKPANSRVNTETPKTDVVQLSDSVQARLMRHEGLSIPQIALKLKLDIKTVTSYFE